MQAMREPLTGILHIWKLKIMFSKIRGVAVLGFLLIILLFAAEGFHCKQFLSLSLKIQLFKTFRKTKGPNWIKNCYWTLIFFEVDRFEIITVAEKVTWDPTDGRNLVWFGKKKEN
jgi:hypothetical protein